MKEYFFSRDDFVAVKFEDRIFPSCTDVDLLLESHLKGTEILFLERTLNSLICHEGVVRIGSYTLDKENNCKYLCIDFDGEGHASPLADAKISANMVKNIFREHGLYPYLERSFSGKGYHVWLFLDIPVSATTLRALADNLIPKDIKLFNGENFSSGKGIEVFPKQSTLIEGGLGNFVFLPLSSSAQENSNIFLDDEFNKFYTDNFDLTSHLKVHELISNISLTSVKESRSDSPVWDIWRKKILESLDLNDIYGEFLTGKDTGQWLQCRDPESETGDNTPSAGVATGLGEFEKGMFHSFISGDNLSVFDFIRKRGLCKDTHLDACIYLANLVNVALPFSEGEDPPETVVIPNIARNIIISNRQFRDILEDAWAVIIENNTPVPNIFKKSNILVSIVDKSLHIMTETDMYGYLGRKASWLKITRDNIMNTLPPDKVAKDIVFVDHEQKNNIPKIEGILNTPIFSRTKELILKNGYNTSGQVWLEMDTTLKIGAIPLYPTETDIFLAKELIINDLFGNFPFASISDIAHIMSALLLPFVRQLIDGPTPLHIIEAPGPGTGKSKICNLISIIATGVACEARSIPNTDEEIRKMVTAELVKSKPIILLDNAKTEKKIDSSSLASILTTTLWTDRLLGASTMLSLSNNALWMLTANNPKLSMEIARRCIRVRLDAKMDQPWRREDFKHKYIEEWTKDNRSLLVKSCLILIQNWIVKGSTYSKRLGSFERWSSVIGGILEVNEIYGFLGNLEEMYEQSDVIGNEWRNFVIHWFKEGVEKNISELLDICDRHNLMSNIIGLVGGAKYRLNLLTIALKEANGRTIANFKVNFRKDKYILEVINDKLLSGDGTSCSGANDFTEEEQRTMGNVG